MIWFKQKLDYAFLENVQGNDFQTEFREAKYRPVNFLTFALVSNEPSPQNVPPPVAVPPMRSYFSSDSTY